LPKDQTCSRQPIRTEDSLLDLYAKRNAFETDYPGISNANFLQFASMYYKGRKGLMKRAMPVVVKTYPTYSCNPKGPSYGLFCKYELLKYKPWTNSVKNAWGDQESCDSLYS